MKDLRLSARAFISPPGVTHDPVREKEPAWPAMLPVCPCTSRLQRHGTEQYEHAGPCRERTSFDVGSADFVLGEMFADLPVHGKLPYG